MEHKLLHDPRDGELRIVGLMSGSGTNLRKILEHEYSLRKSEGTSPYRIVAIFSDTYNSKAPDIGKEYNIPVIIRDIRGFYKAHNRPRRDLSLRRQYDSETVKALQPYNISMAVYAGYMSITTSDFINAFPGINVHPSDLSIMEDGKRKFTGHHAVRDAIAAGAETISSTTHIIDHIVDGGKILMISTPLKVEIPTHLSIEKSEDLKELERINQERLKEAGDWIIFPKTLEYIARGLFAVDREGNLYFDNTPVPQGIRP
jgi:phosphoribosylglycinamide formyltransferase-1